MIKNKNNEKCFFIFSFVFIIIQINFINCGNITCFEYSCAECDSEKFGSCTACRPGFHLIDGTCPCSDTSCALCTTGLAGLNICKLCKNGFYRMEDDCHCDVDNCEICEENGCKKCSEGYFYNSTVNICQKQDDEDENKIKCDDENCDICFSEYKGACDTCKEGYYYEKGECVKNPEPNGTVCGKGFYFSDNSCERLCLGVDCSRNEFYYYTCPSNPCLVCSERELKIFTQCNNSNICQREGCLNCIDNDYCLLCDPGYYLLAGICYKCTYGCSTCNNNETCQQCLSGFKLTDEKTCQLNEDNLNDFDFSINKYKKYRNQLIKRYYPNEIINEEEIDDVIECDSNCKKCYDEKGICKECNELFILQDNKCEKHCSNENCLDCYMRFGNEVCSKCEPGYYVKNDKCVYNCSDPNCLSCYLLEGKELCTQCRFNYKLEDLKCKSKTRIMIIIYIVITGALFVILIICFFYYRKKLIERRRQLELEMHRQNIIPYNMNMNMNLDASDSHRIINKEDILDEFEKIKTNDEKGNQPCQYCNKKAGKFQCDCGCIVCKDHSNLQTVEKNGENIKVCFNCGKPVKKVSQIKYDCNICLQKKIKVVHFKCNCSLVVCKDCYLKCRMESDKCPGCRSIIG